MAVDTWLRYAAVFEVLERRMGANAAILEVGPGWVGLDLFLPGSFWNGGRLVQLDVVRIPLRPPVLEPSRVLASGIALPFADASFDFAVAIDVLEHVAKDARPAFCQELRRVARKGVMLHLPLQSGDGTYQAVRYDRLFRERFEALAGEPDPNIEEHLRGPHPTVEEVEEYFPGASITPTQNGEEWLGYTLRERRRGRFLLFGLEHYLRRSAGGPPYYSARVVWERPS